MFQGHEIFQPVHVSQTQYLQSPPPVLESKILGTRAHVEKAGSAEVELDAVEEMRLDLAACDAVSMRP